MKKGYSNTDGVNLCYPYRQAGPVCRYRAQAGRVKLCPGTTLQCRSSVRFGGELGLFAPTVLRRVGSSSALAPLVQCRSSARLEPGLLASIPIVSQVRGHTVDLELMHHGTQKSGNTKGGWGSFPWLRQLAHTYDAPPWGVRADTKTKSNWPPLMNPDTEFL